MLSGLAGARFACPRPGNAGEVARKTLRWLLPVSLAAVVASQWRDIARYVKINQMSRGAGHPEAVPAVGKHRYPKRPASGASDGSGDFDSASRGGPVSS
jgi:hypothetical protein